MGSLHVLGAAPYFLPAVMLWGAFIAGQRRSDLKDFLGFGDGVGLLSGKWPGNEGRVWRVHRQCDSMCTLYTHKYDQIWVNESAIFMCNFSIQETPWYLASLLSKLFPVPRSKATSKSRMFANTLYVPYAVLSRRHRSWRIDVVWCSM